MFKKYVNNQKGLTLVELLAVIVILGIIAAIAVPSIGSIIDNSKKDAHVANAQQMVSGAKIAVSAESDLLPAVDKGVTYLPLEFLVENGYLDKFTDPDGGEYQDGDNGTIDKVKELVKNNTVPGTSYVKIEKDGSVFNYSVFLDGDKRDIGKANDPVPVENLKRDEVDKKTTGGTGGSNG